MFCIAYKTAGTAATEIHVLTDHPFKADFVDPVICIMLKASKPLTNSCIKTTVDRVMSGGVNRLVKMGCSPNCTAKSNM
jgi:hypothetical protein